MRVGTTPALAQVVINEVLPAPSNGVEWIELYNSSDTPVNVGNWKLEDQLSSPSVLYSFAAEEVMQPGAYLVIDVNNKLNNSGDGVTLINNSAVIVDTMTYTESSSDLSWARQPNSTGVFALSNPSKAGINPPLPSPLPSPSPTPSPSPSLVPSPTPLTSPAPTPSPIPSPSPVPIYPSTLQASEVFACPESGELEWLEIYNPDAQAYTLSNWRLKDRTGNSRVVNLSLPAHSWGVITWGGSLLNNDGDGVSLERPDGFRVFSIEFPACHQQKSFMYYDGAWQETEVITQGGANIWQSPASTTNSSGLENTMSSLDTSPLSPTSLFASPASLEDSTFENSGELSPVQPASPVPWESLHFPVVPSLPPAPNDHTQSPTESLSTTSLTREIPLSSWPIASVWGGSGFAFLSSSYYLFRWYTEHYAQNSFAPS